MCDFTQSKSTHKYTQIDTKRSSTQTYSCCAPDDLTSCNASKCNALDYYGNPKGCVVSQSRTDPFTCSDGYVPVLPTYDTSTGYTCCDQGFTGQCQIVTTPHQIVPDSDRAPSPDCTR